MSAEPELVKGEGDAGRSQDNEPAESVPTTKPDKIRQMNKAYFAVLGGMKAKTAAKYYHISYTSLLRRIHKGENFAYGVGRKPWLSKENEQQLTDWCLSMTNIGCPLTRQLLPQVVKSILDLKKTVVFPPDNLPTHGWVDRFLTRHPILSVRVPEHFGHLRASIRPQVIKGFFTDLNKFLKEEHGIDAAIFLTEENASRIFNCDESGYFLNAADKSSKVMVRRGSKNAYKMGGEGKGMITALSCVSGDGVMYRPLILNKGKRLTVYERYPDLDPSAYNIGYSDNGWITMEIFYSWLVNLFYKELKEREIERPVLLFIDGHSSHLSLETLKFARDNGIIMFCFPPHASHIIQPLDVAVFKSVKQAYREVVAGCRGTLTKGNLPKKSFPYVLMKALRQCNMKSNVVSGFKCTGLLPFDPKAIKSDKFLLTEEESEEEILALPPQLQSPKTPAHYYDEGYKAAQLDCLQRVEAVMPKDTLNMYHERLKDGISSRNWELLYSVWMEIKPTPCPHNPYSGTQSLPSATPSPHLTSSSLPTRSPLLSPPVFSPIGLTGTAHPSPSTAGPSGSNLQLNTPVAGPSDAASQGREERPVGYRQGGDTGIHHQHAQKTVWSVLQEEGTPCHQGDQKVCQETDEHR